MILVGCLVLLLAFGLLERVATARARRAVPIRVHVNGTRGKSTVTRLIAAALREAGIGALAKVTGTSPRLILPDGCEQPIARRAPANIREQSWLVRRAARAGARALVAECMAVRPDLQWMSEREMVRATIGVITNVRRDHTDVMGASLDEICASLSNTIPRGGVLVLGDGRFAASLAPRCAALGTRLLVAGADTPNPSWFDEDVAIALAVTRQLGVDDEVALRGMRRAAPDPGVAARGVATILGFGTFSGWQFWRNGVRPRLQKMPTVGRQIAWLDATAANDPESLDLIVADTATRERLVVYNHRADRPDRLRAFAQFSATFRRARTIVLTGDRPSLTLVAGVRARCPDATVRFVPMRRLHAEIAGAPRAVVFCGNTRGFARPFGPTTNDQRPC